MTSATLPRIVGVIGSTADLQRALQVRNPPDLFELRLDCLAKNIPALKKAIRRLSAPFIVTARHPLEGGMNRLPLNDRRALLLEFLPLAAFVDIELRSSAGLAVVLRAAEANRIPAIISFHDFAGTPTRQRLDKIAAAAQSLGADLVKIATRTDTRPQLDRLLDFFGRHCGRAKVVAMGIGKLGRASRLELARRGCLLNYAHLRELRQAV
jgi:3-dehydroquinate dehydratase-1